VIPTRNRIGLLRQTLASALSQTGVDYEVVVVDNGSTDGTGAYLRDVADPRLRIITDVVGGVSQARNAGLDAARYEWVAFLDDDDLWSPDKLRAQTAASSDGCGWVTVGAVDVDEQLVVTGGAGPPLAQKDTPRLLLANNVPGGGSGTMVRTELARVLGGFDPALSTFADWDLWIRVSQESDMASVCRPLVAYRVHAGSMTHTDGHLFEELAALRHKHAALCARWNVEPAEAVYLTWHADNLLRAGSVRQARSHLRTLVRDHPGRHAVIGCLLAYVAPGSLLRIKTRRHLRRLPPGYRIEAERWLAPYRAAAAQGGPP
jgi:glycosyltransferase involved in cell wall biosynthesis